MAVATISGAAAQAQVSDLASGGAELIFSGGAGERAGTWLDQGSVSAGDTRRDLIVGAPNVSGIGKVYIVFGGPVPSGNVALSTANVIISGVVGGDGFGAVTANGNVLNTEGSGTKTLIVAAPHALSGRGAVYVFATSYTGGERLDASSAVFTITGAAGDALGSTLATADIDGDGYRDIIMGAPGNARVYVVYGGPSLSGTRDLATTSADITMSGSGIGSALAAADVNGDNRYDLLIGAPAVDTAYLINGRASRSFPATMQLAGGEDSYFLGSPGSRAGTSLRVADLDGDGKADVVIGAPAVGSHAGAVYLFWNRTSWTPLATADADVTFSGPWANANLGSVMTSGDINRDKPNDLTMLVAGSGAPDQALVYYGRPRADIGVNTTAGTRSVDLSLDANISRRVIADAAAGGLASSIIYELTGEGARDVIVSAPGSASSSGAASGLVYVVSSPRLSLSPTALALYAGAGSPSPAASLGVNNTSTFGITWAATPQAPWLTASPASGSTSQSAPGLTAVSSTPMAPGVYTGALDVSSTSVHLEMTLSVPVTLTVVSTPTVQANVTFPAMAGTPLTWTASASAGSAALEYRFWRYDSATGWHLVRDYSSNNVYAWTPSFADAGSHMLQVWVRAVGSPAQFDSYTSTDTFAIARPTAQLTSFSSDVAAPQPLGSVIRWTAAATSSSAVEYRFCLYREGSGWSVLQDYGAAPSVTWTPAATGTYAFQVWARVVGATVPYDDWRSSDTFTITNAAPLRLGLTSSPSGPYLAGVAYTFRASSTGGTAGPIQFKFYRYDQPSNLWVLAQDYSASSTYTWTPANPTDLGTHLIQVWARSAGSSAAYEAAQATGNFTVMPNPVTSVALTTSTAFPIPAGTPVKLTAAATGGVVPQQYRFFVFREGIGWSVLQEWSSNASVTWTPSVDGSYALQVWARANGSTATYEAWAGTSTFAVGPSGPASIVGVTSSVPLPANAGTTITWNAQARGGTAGPLQYMFCRLNQQTGVWSVVQNYSTSSTFTWTPTASDTGSYQIQVWVRSSGSSAPYEGYFTTSSFQIK